MARAVTCLLIGWFALLIGASQVSAQEAAPGRSTELFKEGRALVKAGDYAAACPRFAESERLEHAAGTLMNLADCEEHTGKLTKAHMHWRELLRTLPEDGDARREHARQRLEGLERQMPRLVVRLSRDAPPGARVELDGIAMTADQIGVPQLADPGEHRIVVDAEGHSRQSFLVTLELSRTAQVVVRPGDVLPAPAAPAASAAATVPPWSPVPGVTQTPAHARPEPQRRSDGIPPSEPPSATTSHVLFGIGGAAAALGLVFGALALSDRSEFDSTPTEAIANRGEAREKAADISFGVAAALGIAGLLALPSDDTPQRPRELHRARVKPVVTTTGIAASLDLRF